MRSLGEFWDGFKVTILCLLVLGVGEASYPDRGLVFGGGHFARRGVAIVVGFYDSGHLDFRDQEYVLW